MTDADKINDGEFVLQAAQAAGIHVDCGIWTGTTVQVHAFVKAVSMAALRDQFAAAALQGQLVCMVSQKNIDGLVANAEAQGISPKERMVVACYEYADLMLKARGTA